MAEARLRASAEGVSGPIPEDDKGGKCKRWGRTIGLALLGRTPAPVGAPTSAPASAPISAMVQFPGSVLSIPVADLVARMETMPQLRRTCMDHIHALVAQVMDTAASNARESVLRRCVRWLLMADERTGSADLPVTHEALALLLGVRRPGVTLAMAILHGEGLIQTRRGSVRLLDRPGLRAFAATRAVPPVARAA